MAETDTYHVKVEGPGLALERDVSAKVAEQIVILIVRGDPGSGSPTHDSQSATNMVGRPALSLREYLTTHDPKRSPDKITAIGCFLKDHRGKPVFTKSDLEACFEEAAEPVPKNIPRDLKWAIRVGWVAPKSGDKNAFYVTSKGVEVVKNKFPVDVLKKTLQASSTTRRLPKKPVTET